MKKINRFIGSASSIPLSFRYNTDDIIDAGDSFYDATGECYSALFADKKKDDISFYVSLAKERGGPILEAACGDGRILIPVASAGINVTGSDVSEEMLRICREKMKDLPDQIRPKTGLCRADLRALPFRQKFRMVFLPYNSFNHLLNREGQNACIRGIHDALQAGGTLVMEVLPYHENYDRALMLRKKIYIPEKKTKVVMYSRLEHDKENCRHKVHWFTQIKKRGKKPKRMITTFTRKDIPLEVVIGILTGTGFNVEDIFYDYRRNTEKGDKRLIIAEKV